MDSALIIGGLLAWLAFSGKKKSPTPPPANPNDPNAPLPTVFVPGVVEPEQPEQPLPTVFVPGVVEPPRPGDWPAVYKPNYPTPGAFYTVVPGDTFLGKGIAFKALATAMYEGAREAGESHEQAIVLASSFANDEQRRIAYMRAIEGDAWNDHLYGTYGYGPSAMPNPVTKRAIRLLPQNADNAERLSLGLPPIRSVKLSTPNNAKQGTGTKAPGAPGGFYETLYLPAINAAHAYQTGQLLVSSDSMPAWVRDLGIIDRSGAPAGTKWGAS